MSPSGAGAGASSTNINGKKKQGQHQRHSRKSKKHSRTLTPIPPSLSSLNDSTSPLPPLTPSPSTPKKALPRRRSSPNKTIDISRSSSCSRLSSPSPIGRSKSEPLTPVYYTKTYPKNRVPMSPRRGGRARSNSAYRLPPTIPMSPAQKLQQQLQRKLTERKTRYLSPSPAARSTSTRLTSTEGCLRVRACAT